MSKEYLQKLYASEQHLRHVVLELVAEHLEENAEDIIGSTLYTYDLDPENDSEAYAEQEQAVKEYELFADPANQFPRTISVEQLAVLGPRDRMFTFTLSNGTPIDHLVAWIVDLPLESVPDRVGVIACRARDTGDDGASAFVGILSCRLSGRVGYLKWKQKKG